MESTHQQQMLHLALVSTTHRPQTVWPRQHKSTNPAHIAEDTHQKAPIESHHGSIQHACNGIVNSHLAKTSKSRLISLHWNTSSQWCCHNCKSLFYNIDQSLDIQSRPLSWPRGLGPKDYAIVALALSRRSVTADSTPALGLVCLPRSQTYSGQLSRDLLDLSTCDRSYLYRKPYMQHYIQPDYTPKMALVPQRRPARTSSNTQSTRSALNITLGIEQEFLILESCEAGQRPILFGQEASDHGKSLVSPVLQKPVQLECSSCGHTHHTALPLRVQDKLHDNSNHECWNVVGDTSMNLESPQIAVLRENDCDAYGVELTSRVLSIDQARPISSNTTYTKHKHTFTYHKEISGVFNAMNEAFAPRRESTVNHCQERRMVINKTCALHVHIGNGTNGFELQTIKNLLSICTAFERVMDGMHAASRIGCSTLALTPLDHFSELEADANGTNLARDGALSTDIFNKALTERVISSAYATRRNDSQTPNFKAARDRYPAVEMDNNPILKQVASGFDTKAFVEVIQQAPTMESLQKLMGSCSETNVNILHLITSPDGEQNVSETRPYRRLNTIEFRQHAATTDPEDAIHWIDFLQTLVRYAHSQSAKSIIPICARLASDPNFDLPAMFELLGVAQDTRAFYLNGNNDKLQTAIDKAEQLSLHDPFRKTILELAEERAADYHPENFSKAILNKFKEGGYGQFSREFVEAYAPQLSKEDEERLVIGWEAPLWSSMEWKEDEMKDEDDTSV
jgi:hypothetical protein